MRTNKGFEVTFRSNAWIPFASLPMLLFIVNEKIHVPSAVYAAFDVLGVCALAFVLWSVFREHAVIFAEDKLAFRHGRRVCPIPVADVERVALNRSTLVIQMRHRRLPKICSLRYQKDDPSRDAVGKQIQHWCRQHRIQMDQSTTR